MGAPNISSFEHLKMRTKRILDLVANRTLRQSNRPIVMNIMTKKIN